MHLKQVNKFLEVFHELFVVNSSITINIGLQRQCDNLFLSQVKFLELTQAVSVFIQLKESIRVAIELLEDLEKFNITIDWHDQVGRFELAKLNKLSLSFQ